MGCFNSKAEGKKKKKNKERDTLSQEAAAEDERLSRQNTSALQAAGLQPREDGDQITSPPAQDPDQLEVPVPDETPQRVAAPAAPTPPPPPQEAVETVKEKAEESRKTAQEKKHKKSRGHRHSGSSTGSSRSGSSKPSGGNTESDESDRSSESSVPAKGRGRHKGKRSSGSESASRSHIRGKGAKKKKDTNKKKKREKHAKTPPTSGSSQGESSQARDPLMEAPVHPANGSHAAAVSLSRARTHRTSASGSSLSFELQSEASPSATHETPYANLATGAAAAQGSSYDRNMMMTTTVNQEAGTPRASHVSLPSVRGAESIGGRQESLRAVEASRLSYEPYSEAGLHRRGVGEGEGDDLVPPYEWVPRTMPVPSPLRHQQTGYELSPAATYGDAGWSEYRIAEGDSGSSVSRRFSERVDAAPAPPPRYDSPSQPAARYVDAAARDDAWFAPPLEPRTFYPHLPQARWPSSSAAAAAGLSAPSPQWTPSSLPASQHYGDEYGGQLGRMYRDEDHHQQQHHHYSYGDTPALYSPAEEAYEPHRSSYPREARLVAAPPLESAYMSNGREAYKNHDGGSRGYSTSQARPRISVLPSAYSYGPSPMVSAAEVEQDAVEWDDYRDGANSYAPAAPLDRRHDHHHHRGVSAHQYKPVTYLFDNSMDNWLQRRRTAAPQRELYDEAADLW